MIHHRDTENTEKAERRESSTNKTRSHSVFSLFAFSAISVSLWFISAFPCVAGAAEPTIRDVNIRGLQINGTTTISVTGDDLGKTPKLLLPFPAKQTLKPGNTDKKADFDVTLESATPGLHHLRVVTDGGVSLPLVVGVDALEQKPFAAKVDSLPVALHGSLTGSTVLETTFTGKAGQKLSIEVESQRVGGKLRPVIHLYNAKKLQLDWAWGKPALNGDTRLTTTLPADGAYTVTLHDAEYAGAAPGVFRLKIGTFDYAEQLFPLVVTKDTKSVELFGSANAKIELPAKRGSTIALDWSKAGVWSGPRPFVEVSARPEFVETNASEKQLDLPQGRVGVCGKLATPNEEDKFRVAVEPKSKIRIEVLAERIGSQLDPAIIIRDDKGGILARGEDSPGSLDPVLEYTVPDKITTITVCIADTQGQGNARGIYRLLIDPVKGEGLGDFRLTTPLQRLNMSSNGRAIVPVYVDRRGFTGAIEIVVDGLPATAKLEGTTIPADADGTLVIVTTTGDVTPQLVTFKGRAGTEERPVAFRAHPLERLQPWLATEFAIAPTTAKSADFSIAWKTLPADAGLSPAGKLALPVTLTRTDIASPVRLTLLTNQSPPLNNNQPDPNRAIRLEKATEFGAKVSEGEVPVVIPPELPANSYQVAVLAELLTPDKQRVVASAVTPVRVMPVKLPVAIKAASPTIEAKINAKTPGTVEVTGTVERLHGFAGEVSVTLTGVPPGVPAPAAITVKPGETAFAFKLTVPVNLQPSETKLKVGATVAPDPKQPNVRVKSRDIELTLKLVGS
jgi:hypothetical protein